MLEIYSPCAHSRLWLTLGALATLAATGCGDDSGFATSVSGSSSGTTGDSSSSSGATTTDTPTGSATDTGGGGTGPTTSETTSETTMGIDASSSGDGTTTGNTTTADNTTSTTTGDGTTGTTADDTTSTGDDFACDAPPFPDVSAAPVIAGCPQTGESQWCLALTSGSVTAIGLDSQTTCQATTLLGNDIEVFAVGSFGVVGSELFTCTSEFDGLAARVDLLTGAVELSTLPCTAITTWRGHPVVQDTIGGDTLDIYQDWDDLLIAQVAWSFTPAGLFSETLTTHDDTLFAAWHSDNHVDRFDLPCGEPLGPVLLEGFDDWLQGIAVSDDLRLITHGFSYAGMRSFDAGTGLALAPFPDVFLDGVGLGCYAQQ